MADKTFIHGMIVKDPRNNAPEFILGHLSIKVDELIPFLQKHAKNGWVNVDLCRGRSGKPYASLDNWEPQQQSAPQQRQAPAPPPFPSAPPTQQAPAPPPGEPSFEDESFDCSEENIDDIPY